MCLASAYTTKDGMDTLVIDKVTSVSVNGPKILLTNLLGLTAEVEGALKNIDLNKSVIMIQQ